MPKDLNHPPPERDLTSFLSFRVLRAHHALNSQATELLARTSGLGLGQWRVLALVGAGIADSSKSLAQKSGLDPAFISRTMRTLEADGLIHTSRPDRDRRQLDVKLTEEGRELYEKTLPHMQARQQRLLDALSEDERALVFGILEKIENAAAERPDPK